MTDTIQTPNRAAEIKEAAKALVQKARTMFKSTYANANERLAALAVFSRELRIEIEKTAVGMPDSLKEATAAEILKTVFARIPAKLVLRFFSGLFRVASALFGCARDVLVVTQNMIAKAVNACTKKETLTYWSLTGLDTTCAPKETT